MKKDALTVGEEEGHVQYLGAGVRNDWEPRRPSQMKGVFLKDLPTVDNTLSAAVPNVFIPWNITLT